MVVNHFERTESNFRGTIIDLETIGDFDRQYYSDSRQYRKITPVIFGTIDGRGIRITCAKNVDSISELRGIVMSLLPSLEKPFHAFNSDFERGILFHYTGKEVAFEGELNAEKYEKKELVVRALGIPNYDDPFNGNGFLCSQAWSRGELEKAIRHNRSCLLKERDILLKRGFRKPDLLELIP